MAFFIPCKFKPNIKPDIIRKLFRFSAGNYVANFLQYGPAFILPIIITAKSTPENTAFFYMALMISSVIFIIPIAISQSLLAEESNKPKKDAIKKAYRFSFTLLVPAIITVVFASKYIMLLFGPEYSVNGSGILQILALSAIPFAFNTIYIVKKNVEKRTRHVVFINFLIATVTLAGATILLDYSFIGIGYAWFFGQVTGNIYILFSKIKDKITNNSKKIK